MELAYVHVCIYRIQVLSRVRRNLQSPAIREESKRDHRFPLLSRRFGFLEISRTDSRHYREIQFLWKQFPPRLPASRNSSQPAERRKIREQGRPVVVVPAFHTHPLHPRGHVSLYPFSSFIPLGSVLPLTRSLFFSLFSSVPHSRSLSLPQSVPPSLSLSRPLSLSYFRNSSTFVGV